MSTRTYEIRDSSVTVHELPDVLAVSLSGSRTDLSREDHIRELDLGEPAEELTGVRDETVQAFMDANWAFVEPSNTVRSAFEAGETVGGTTHIGQVYRDEDGELMVGSDRLTVRFKAGTSDEVVRDLLEENDLTVIREFGFLPNLYEVRVAPGDDPLDVVSSLTEEAAVEYAEPEMIQHLPQRDTVEDPVGRFEPSDPEYTRQWQWRNIDIEQAWATTRGSGVRIAVIDNGFELDHPDLEKSVTDAAGYFQSAGGAGAVFVPGPENHPASQHGTFCAGMAVARVNNGHGGCGAAPESEFMPVTCLPDQIGTQTSLARAIAYAADPSTESTAVEADIRKDDGADVISCSLGPSGGANWVMHSILRDAIDFAVGEERDEQGVPLFWAASNGDVTIDGEDGTDQVVSYPKTIAVGRATKFDTEHGSAFGPALDFLAPGVNVFSTATDDGYTASTGTSYATPCAAGVAALMISLAPNLTWDTVRSLMRETCDKVGDVDYGADGHHDRYGYGRINAKRAVEAASEHTTTGGDGEPDDVTYPSIEGPRTTLRTGDPPVFDIELGFNNYGLVEVATDPALFDYDNHDDDHETTNIYPLWGVDEVALSPASEWQLPDDVWERLSFEEDSRLWYRLHTSSIDDGWDEYYVTTENADASTAPSVEVTSALPRPPGNNESELPRPPG